MKHQPVCPTIALDLQFRHMSKIEALRRTSAEQLESLRPFAVRGSRCEVVFDQSHSAKQGEVYQVALRLHIPGQPLYVTHHTESGGSKELLFSVLNDAFSDIRRQMLKNRTRRFSRRRLAA